MEWSKHKNGWLAKSKRGYLFVFNRFDEEVGFKRWFALYASSAPFTVENSTLICKRHGYISLPEAKFEAEQTMKLAWNSPVAASIGNDAT